MQNKQDFTEQLGTTFSIDLSDGATYNIELIAVDNVLADTTEAGQAEPFSALFRATGEASLEQGTYTLKHAGVGEVLLFIVPIGPDEVGMRYEAVFT